MGDKNNNATNTQEEIAYHTNRVISFINKFTYCNSLEQVLDVFSDKGSYWFAVILSKRFVDGYIVYNPTHQCFAYYVKQCDTIFNIYGKVWDGACNKEAGEPYKNWDEYNQTADKAEIAKIFYRLVSMTG